MLADNAREMGHITIEHCREFSLKTYQHLVQDTAQPQSRSSLLWKLLRASLFN
jgi:hypothetical protein